jgi:hypothetical protein
METEHAGRGEQDIAAPTQEQVLDRLAEDGDLTAEQEAEREAALEDRAGEGHGPS